MSRIYLIAAWLYFRVRVTIRHTGEKKGTARRSLFLAATNSVKKNAGVSCSLASYRKAWLLLRTPRRWTTDISSHQRKFPSAPCYQPGRRWWNIHSRPRLSLGEEFGLELWLPSPCCRKC